MGRVQICYLFLLPFMVQLVDESGNSLMSLFLQDKDYFGLSLDEARDTLANGNIAISVLNIVVVIIWGYLFDLTGRRCSIFFAFLVCGIGTAILPFTSPNAFWCMFIFASAQSLLTAGQYAPVFMDYCAVETFAAGNALGSVGQNFGTIVTLGVNVQLTKELNPRLTWLIQGIIPCAFAVATLFMVREPKDKPQGQEMTQMRDLASLKEDE